MWYRLSHVYNICDQHVPSTYPALNSCNIHFEYVCVLNKLYFQIEFVTGTKKPSSAEGPTGKYCFLFLIEKNVNTTYLQEQKSMT